MSEMSEYKAKVQERLKQIATAQGWADTYLSTVEEDLELVEKAERWSTSVSVYLDVEWTGKKNERPSIVYDTVGEASLKVESEYALPPKRLP